MRRNLLGYRAEVVEDMFGASDALAEVLSDTLGDGGRVLLVADSNVVSHTSWLGQKIGRYFISIVYVFAVITLTIWISLLIDNTLTKVERGRSVIVEQEAVIARRYT